MYYYHIILKNIKYAFSKCQLIDEKFNYMEKDRSWSIARSARYWCCEYQIFSPINFS